MIPREDQRGRPWILMVLALLLLASATALAGTTGNLTGYVTGPNDAPLPGVRISVTAPVLQGSKTATTDSQGFFRITQLPPGPGYRARFEAAGYKTTERSGIVLNIDATIKLPTVKMQTQQAVEAIEVVESAPVVEQGSTAVGRTMSSEFLTTVPTGRNTTAVLQLAPGAATDAIGTTFRGATSPENNYVIDGLNTTGILYGLDTSALPPEFIREIQVKTGGYEPEHGRATGGQSIVITKSGGNEFHGDVFLYITPFEGRRHTVINGDVDLSMKDGGSSHAARIYNRHDQIDAQIGFDIGGYIVKDRLWFFAGYAPQFQRTLYTHEFRLLGDPDINPAAGDLYSDAQTDPDPSDAAVTDKQDWLTHYYILNFTFNINQSHSIRFGATGNPTKVTGVWPGGTLFYEPGNYLGTNVAGSMDFSIIYNGQFLGGLMNLDVVGGYHVERDRDTPYTGTYESYSQNSVFDGTEINGNDSIYQHRYYHDVAEGCANLDGSESGIDCSMFLYRTGGLGFIAWTRAERLTFKPVLSIFVNNFVGNHVFKLGGDIERNHVLNGRAYTAGAVVDQYLRSYDDDGDPGTPNVPYYLYRERYFSNFGEAVEWGGIESFDSFYGAETFTRNASIFVQDSWSILSNLNLNLGVRWERQALTDTQDIVRILLNDNIAPRIGVSFDFTKEGKSKLFANFGRYYESIPQDINDRALSAEGFNYYLYDSIEFPNYSPGAQPLTDDYLLAFLGGHVSEVQANLKGQYADEFLLGFEYEVMKDLSAGITGVYRTLPSVIEDISPDDGHTYLIANPGSDNFEYYETQVDEDGNLLEPEIAVDENGDPIKFRQCFAAIDPLTGAPATYCFPKADRFYRAIELQFVKRFSGNWTAQASYTWSQTFGNYPGLFAQSRGQNDPNITSQFDLANLLANRYGYLDTDRRHLIKLAGAYTFNFGTMFGLSAQVQSGIPILYLGAHPVYGGAEAFIIPRGLRPDDAPADIPERTPWIFRIDANVRHTFTFADKRKLGVGVQVNNILNADSYERVDQLYTNNVSNPAVGGTSISQVQCYDEFTYLPLVSNCERQPNSGKATGFQAPLSVRFEVKYSF